MMDITEKRYSIGNVGVCVQSNVEFDLPQHYDAFLVNDSKDNFKEDLLIRIFEVNILATKVNDVNIGVAIHKNTFFYKDKEKETIVYYLDNNQRNICWSAVREYNNYNTYNIEVLKNSVVNISNLDPFLIIDVSRFLIDYSAIMLHASVVNYRNKGIVFTAPSGTGKSTQANLWNKFLGADIINGDRAIISKTKRYRVYGSPYAGSSEIYKNDSVDLSAIVVLKQSSINKIRRLEQKEAFIALISETNLFKADEEYVNRQMSWLLNMIDVIPVYLLECRPDREAVELVLKILEG